MKNNKLITINYHNQGKNYWLNKSFVNETLYNSITNSNILIVPIENFKNTNSFAFTHETENIFFFLKENLQNEVEICIGDESLQVLALHADIKRMGEFLVNSITLPILLGLLTSYIDRNYLSNNTPTPIVNNITIDKKVIVNATINIEQNENNVISITYEGPAEKFKENIEKAVKDINATN